MATTIEAVESMLRDLGQASARVHGALTLRRDTDTYRDAGGRAAVGLVIQVAGDRLRIAAPYAFAATGPHIDATLRACMLLQYASGGVRLDYDERDGEIRAVIDVPLADAPVTAAQIALCLSEIGARLDAWYPTVTRTRDTGIIGFPLSSVDRDDALRLLATELRGRGEAADRTAADIIDRHLP